MLEHHADIVVHAAENGVPAIYCEKGLAPSLIDANRMSDACNSNGVILNLGAHRRFHPGFRKVREMVESGELGPIKIMVMNYADGLFDHGCHVVDLAQFLNGDSPAVWVQAHAPQSDPLRKGSVYEDDPGGHGVVLFENNVILYLLNTDHYESRIECENGIVETFNDTEEWNIRTRPDRSGAAFFAGKTRESSHTKFPHLPKESGTMNIILDLVRALDTGDPPMGGMEAARHGVEIMVAILESHLQDGKRVYMPLEHSELRMERASRQPWEKGARWREPRLSPA